MMRNCKKNTIQTARCGEKVNRFTWPDVDLIKSFTDDPEERNEDNLYVVL